MIQLNRQYSQDYATNSIDYGYSFNSGSNWTVSSGTGTAILDGSQRFEGESSLKIENTDPTNDLITGNSSLSTVINHDGNYNLSLYLLKNEADEVLTLEIQVFKNAVLLDTQDCVLGNEVSADDINNKWVRFQSDQTYAFIDTDVVTVTFTLKGKSGTTLPLTRLWVDGMMLADTKRLSSVTPFYSKPDRFKDLPDLPTGDGNYQLNVNSGLYSWTTI